MVETSFYGDVCNIQNLRIILIQKALRQIVNFKICSYRVRDQIMEQIKKATK